VKSASLPAPGSWNDTESMTSGYETCFAKGPSAHVEPLLFSSQFPPQMPPNNGHSLIGVPFASPKHAANASALPVLPKNTSALTTPLPKAPYASPDLCTSAPISAPVATPQTIVGKVPGAVAKSKSRFPPGSSTGSRSGVSDGLDNSADVPVTPLVRLLRQGNTPAEVTQADVPRKRAAEAPDILNGGDILRRKSQQMVDAHIAVGRLVAQRAALVAQLEAVREASERKAAECKKMREQLATLHEAEEKCRERLQSRTDLRVGCWQATIAVASSASL